MPKQTELRKLSLKMIKNSMKVNSLALMSDLLNGSSVKQIQNLSALFTCQFTLSGAFQLL